MKRREVIASTPIVLLAGCSGDSSNNQNTEGGLQDTPTPSPSPTETPTPASRRPEVAEANLVTEWKEFGDVVENTLGGAGRGATIVIGYRYSVQIHDGVHDITKQARIYDSTDTRIAQKSSEDRQLVDSEGYQEWEGAFYFETTDWELDDYEVEVIVRDNISGDVSPGGIGEFSLNAPLQDGDATLVSYNGPDSLEPEESYSYTLELENNTNRDSSVISPLSGRYNGSNWYTYEDSQFQLTIPSGETRVWESNTATAPSDSGKYAFRIDDIGETWSFEVV